MDLLFRLNFHTKPGQSLWLKYSLVLNDNGVQMDTEVPMVWLNDRQLQAVVKLHGVGRFQVKYHYQLRKLAPEYSLDEWETARTFEVAPENHDACVLLDTWSSAGTIDYAFETKACLATRPPRAIFDTPKIPVGANHCFRLRMAAVPHGKVPCLIGSVTEMGNWGWHSAIPMDEIAPNVWQKFLQLPDDGHVEYKYALFDTALQCVTSMELGENRFLSPHAAGSRQWTEVNDECYRRDTAGMFRGAGVAIPVFSLRSKEGLGVGEFADLKALSDWAKITGIKLIQILPINDTTTSNTWRDSYPYSAISVFALHPLYLRIDDLPYPMPPTFTVKLAATKALLNPLEQMGYEATMLAKREFTREIFAVHRMKICGTPEFIDFLTEFREWLIPYAVFCVKRDFFGTADFTKWGEWATFDQGRMEEIAVPTSPEWIEICYHVWLQYELDRQLRDAVAHLHANGIALKGDLPIGIDRCSVDAWTTPHLFKMDAQAGAPPDAFAVKGQNWGFPTYNWDVMKLDGFAWWRGRFTHLSRYFDAYRIDHILGFFRIWQVPYEQVEGIMGYFDPALPIHLDEFHQRGIGFDFNRFCRPHIRWDALVERFGDSAEFVRKHFLHDCEGGCFKLREHVLTQRRIIEFFAENPHEEYIRKGLLDCVSDVMFFEVEESNGTLFHPRMGLESTHSFRNLNPEIRHRVKDLYVDYFFRRQEEFWEAEGYQKLPTMRRASTMLLCGEDLGMVPACVPGVLKELGILSLEIQRMPKSHKTEFFHPQHANYLSVVSPSTHDMSTLRAWWKEDPMVTARWAWQMCGISFPEAEMSGDMASTIIQQHAASPAMWAIFPLQDLLAIDEKLRHPDPDAERINIPVVIPFNWCYRMHLDLQELLQATSLNKRLLKLFANSGR